MEYKIHLLVAKENRHNHDPTQEDPEMFIGPLIEDLSFLDEVAKIQRDRLCLVIHPVKDHNHNTLHSAVKGVLKHYFVHLGPFEHE